MVLLTHITKHTQSKNGEQKMCERNFNYESKTVQMAVHILLYVDAV